MQDPKERFGFGENWEEFIKKHFSRERVAIAGEHILDFLNLTSLKGQYFLDIGCGSGLHSLAALESGASRVVSFDYDQSAVNITKSLKEFAGNPSCWQVMQGSILDEGFLRSLEPADIVYSWGVLHHTGSMWHAMDNSAALMKENGLLYIALYDYDIQVNPPAEFWLDVKRRYNRSSRLHKRRMELWYIWTFMLNRRLGNLPKLLCRIAGYKRGRGMAFYTDVRDWLGGWPMEFAKRRDVAEWAEKTGLTMVRLKTGEANSEYLFKKASSQITPES